MNVLLLSHRVPYPPNKGEKIRTFHHLSSLVEQGHSVVVATPVEDEAEKAYAQQLSEKFNIQVVHSQLPPRPTRLLKGLVKGQPLSVANFRTHELQTEIDQLIDSNKPDVIMCTSSSMAAYVFNDSTIDRVRSQNTRLVMDFMDLDSLKWQQYAERKIWPLSHVYNREAKLLSALENKVLADFDASLFVSAEEKELLKNKVDLIKKVHVISNGVDTNTYYPAPEKTTSASNNEPTLLFTGVMDYFPNEDAVIWFAEDAWPLIKKNYANAKFIIAGMRPSRKVKALTSIDGVEVTGFVDDILPYYQQADILIAPFRVARGLQNKVLQAMACGLPVVTSEAGATGIKCEPGRDLLVASDAESYLTTITQLLNDAQQQQALREAGLTLVTTEYSWDTENAKLANILSGTPSQPAHSTNPSKPAEENSTDPVY